jgi:hypothetical protein
MSNINRNKMARNKSACGTNKNKRSEGGRRKSGKSRKASTWTKSVTALYHKMKKEDKSVSFRDALVKASKLKKEGKL